ncbi:TetR/AcrR family transcriptional regulator [Actinoplanes sp. NPDC051411]|uniref:TetR/AcrR family transcriptional regulator n=1 Tax=Actinoplanes sp. NPDC051411 TaxID=3155522 RepID=UPI00342B3679
MPSTTPRRVRRDVVRNREALLVSAADAFARHGVDASLEDIAQRAGVGSATLYRHFPTRDDLVAGVYRRRVEDVCAEVDTLLTDLPADQALERWMQGLVNFVFTKRGMAAAIRGAVHQSEPFKPTRTVMLDALARLIETGVEQGLLRADASAEAAMKALSAFCLLDEADDRLVEILVDGLRYRAGAPQ